MTVLNVKRIGFFTFLMAVVIPGITHRCLSVKRNGKDVQISVMRRHYLESQMKSVGGNLWSLFSTTPRGELREKLLK
jgi:hypothetical protein